MKRLMPILVIAALLCGLFAACAEVDYLPEAGMFRVRYDGCIEGEDYLLYLTEVVSSGIVMSDVLYLNQFTAGGEVVDLLIPDDGYCRVTAYLAGRMEYGVSTVQLGDSVRTELRTPSGVSEIGREAFAGCTFTHVYLGGNVTGIGEGAFKNCASLRYVYLPSSVETIAYSAFDGCSLLTLGFESGNETALAYALRMDIPYVFTD